MRPGRNAPEEQADKEQAGQSGCHVTLTHPRPGEFAGTSWLEASGDTQDLTGFYDLVCAEAKQLGRLGDTDDYETRKAKALGIIAARQGALDLTDAVDRHDPPPWMRELVILRDGQCMFPLVRPRRAALRPRPHHAVRPTRRRRTTRQTNSQNVAPLCRRHHRAKTFTAWQYARQGDGTHDWISPHARTYLVTADGTLPVSDR